jgi:hypothetical protein
MRTLLICFALVLVCVLLLVSHVMETPRTALLASLLLGTIAGIGDVMTGSPGARSCTSPARALPAADWIWLQHLSAN